MRKKYFKRLWLTLATILIVMALMASLFRALTPLIRQHKTDLEQLLSHISGQQVEIAEIETGWFWFEPVLKLKDVKIVDSEHDIISLQKLQVGINLFRSLWSWQIQPGMLLIEQVHLDIRQDGTRWTINGFKSGQTDVQNISSQTGTELLKWIANQQKIVLRDIGIRLYFTDKTVIPIEHINATVKNSSGLYHLKASASLKQTTPTFFDMRGLISFDPDDWQDTNGEIYLSVRHFLPYQWQRFWPHQLFSIHSGQGNVRMWLGIGAGALKNVQAKVKLKHLSWSGPEKQQGLIQKFSANMAYNHKKDGWTLSADNLMMRVNGISWPKNQFLVNYQYNPNRLLLKIKHIDIHSVEQHLRQFAAYLPEWPADAVHGRLNDTTIMISDEHPLNVSTRFVDLGWQGTALHTGVDHLQGVVDFSKDHGMLELDSHDVLLSPENMPAVHLNLIQGNLEWKQLSQGYRFHLDRMAIQEPQTTITANGVADVSEHTVKQMNLKLQYSLKEAEKWLKYLPFSKIKPKLGHWLSHDIHRIGHLAGTTILSGDLPDFPFDKGSGTFESINDLSDVDLVFAKDWPVTKHIFAALNVQGRHLSAAINKATLMSMDIHDASIDLPDMGLGQETLLVMIKSNPKAEDLISYLLNTPIVKKVQALKFIHLKNKLNLKVDIKAPLYPENDDILVNADVLFDKNPLMLDIYHQKLKFSDISGWMNINEKGVVDSRIEANMYHQPLSMSMHRVADVEKPYTELNIAATTKINTLRENSHFDIPDHIMGQLFWKSKIKITDDTTDLDEINITSDLKDLIINLPKPLGKSAEQSRLLNINIDFNPVKAVRINAAYDKTLGMDLWFNKTKAGFDFDAGEIRLGSSHAIRQKQQRGLQILGNIPEVNIEEWLKVIKSKSQQARPMWITKLAFIDIKINMLTWMGRTFKNLHLKANKVEDAKWIFNLEQALIQGMITYDFGKHAIEGKIKKLDLPLPKQTSSDEKPLYQPSEMPDINLNIEHLKVGDYALGNVIIKGHHQDAGWVLTDGELQTPWSRLLSSGRWVDGQHGMHTELKGTYESHDLSATMKNWHLPRVVFAKKTNITYAFDWPGAPEQLKLAKLNGQMSATIRDGRIIELSKETEEKLGLGRLLSVLSLQTIPRRLKLDFSDLSDAGYAFDVFKGNFAIQNGKMQTKDAYIDGPVAYASMKGMIDLAHKRYDLDLRISPHITASLPIVATIAGGPVAGVAAWVVNKIISQGMQQISAWTYHISGPWDKPVVQQVKFIRKKQQQGR